MKFRYVSLCLSVLLLALFPRSSSATALAHRIPGRVGQITEYPLQPYSGPTSIVLGSDGNLWFTQFERGNIGRINPSTGKVTLIGDNGFSPMNLTFGPDHNLWVTEYSTHQIERLTPYGHFTSFPLPDGTGSPEEIKTGSDGNVWFTVIGFPEHSGQPSYIGRLTLQGTAQGQITLYQLPNPQADPQGLVATVPDGTIWFTESWISRLGNLDPKTGKISEYPLGASEPERMTLGPDGNLWFTEYAASRIGRFNPKTGKLSEFALPGGYAVPWGITVGPDHNLWFTENRNTANNIGRITVNGQVSSYPIPTQNSHPEGITAGPGHTLWFCEWSTSKLGKITTQ